MVQSATRDYQCNGCMTEWAIEPEPYYQTWEEMGHEEPTEIVDEFVFCSFCGSTSVIKLD